MGGGFRTDAMMAGLPTFPIPPLFNNAYQQARLARRAALINPSDDVAQQRSPKRCVEFKDGALGGSRVSERLRQKAAAQKAKDAQKKREKAKWGQRQLSKNATITLSRPIGPGPQEEQRPGDVRKVLDGLEVIEEDVERSQFASKADVHKAMVERLQGSEPADGPRDPVSLHPGDKRATTPHLATREDLRHMLNSERVFMLSWDHRKKYSGYRFTRSLGIAGYFGVMNFNDVLEFEDRSLWNTEVHPWPKRLELYLMNMKAGKRILIGCVVAFPGRPGEGTHDIAHWGQYAADFGLVIEFAEGERIYHIRMCPGTFLVDGRIVHHGISYFEVRTTWGRRSSIGTADDTTIMDMYSPTLNGGFMGFYGAVDRALDRLGVVWGV
ncbi:uncharacterized protein EI90DRAFT_675687 [Cantharellus anzutake]|uniref:uncharacterized protein n=1 Tax=Cantharellus anzutake TaxID=1750568 RepID=UPI001908CDA5|nr:uncharacterized protein EI90DRAFT_675687 [Cantharellus anzutake]KAF8332616.1 hypothetical protein EI90DRAFT_675687 [Cantharellus anzutake]